MLSRFTSLMAVGILTAGSTFAADPYAEPDDSWISISGTVTSTEPDSFMLDYGKGLVTVEMDDWDNYGDAYGLLAGDDVTVYGRVDDDLYDITTIEASSVYVEDLNTFFEANPADEEDAVLVDVWTVATPIEAGQVTLRGTVTSVSEEEFTIDTGVQQMTVEVEEMGYNPLDDQGYQKIEEGDVVSVDGWIDDDFFEGRELVADSVITLADNDEG